MGNSRTMAIKEAGELARIEAQESGKNMTEVMEAVNAAKEQARQDWEEQHNPDSADNENSTPDKPETRDASGGDQTPTVDESIERIIEEAGPDEEIIEEKIKGPENSEPPQGQIIMENAGADTGASDINRDGISASGGGYHDFGDRLPGFAEGQGTLSGGFTACNDVDNLPAHAQDIIAQTNPEQTREVAAADNGDPQQQQDQQIATGFSFGTPS